MRTTLAIDILITAKALARQQGKSVGEVVSKIARHAMRRAEFGGERNGIPLLSPRPNTPPVTLEIVNELRDELQRHFCRTSMFLLHSYIRAM